MYNIAPKLVERTKAWTSILTYSILDRSRIRSIQHIVDHLKYETNELFNPTFCQINNAKKK